MLPSSNLPAQAKLQHRTGKPNIALPVVKTSVPAHGGSLTTVHANNAESALSRIASMNRVSSNHKDTFGTMSTLSELDRAKAFSFPRSATGTASIECLLVVPFRSPRRPGSPRTSPAPIQTRSPACRAGPTRSAPSAPPAACGPRCYPGTTRSRREIRWDQWISSDGPTIYPPESGWTTVGGKSSGPGSKSEVLIIISASDQTE